VTPVSVRIERASPFRLEAVVRYVAAAQADPLRHVTYVGEDGDSILEEFAEAERWEERLLVAVVGDDAAGVLMPDIDEEMRRVWWIGPWADTEDIAVELLSEARRHFGSRFDEEEMAPDSRNALVRSVAARTGFSEGTWSSVLSRHALDPSGKVTSVSLEDDRLDAVAALHERLFPGTHTHGDRFVHADGTRIRTIDVDGCLAGYVAFEIQADGTGYIDFLGVDAATRRRGIGRALVADVCREFATEGVPSVHLTVRADAPGAVDLYRSLGFIEERLIVPCRLGFSLD
jgi:ribosomal protein S18 acetylase RimI-like enzyme